MVKLPEFNRHMAGVSAIALALLGLGYMANMTGDHRRIASLSGQGARVAASSPEASSNDNFLSMLGRTPPNVFGYASTQSNSGASTQSRASLPGEMRPNGRSNESIAAGSKDWTADEWQVAAEAVTRARSSSKGRQAAEQAVNKTASGIVWQPPAEIAGHNSRR